MAGTREARWYTHPFNTDRSWRLILGVMPRVPAPLRAPIHHAVTTVFFLAMGNERRAAKRNVERITGERGARSLAATYRLFLNYSRFLVAYTEMPPHARTPDDLAARIAGTDDALRTLRAALAAGKGLILAGVHLGQWDLALVLLARLGIPVTVVMRREDEEAARHAAAVREAAGIRIVHPGDSAWLGVELLAALRRGEIVALQADRAYGERTAHVTLFGGDVAIPAGPWDLSRASGAPILTAVAVIEGPRTYRFVCGDALDATAGGVERLAAEMETLIARHPEQWFNFYDVWGEPRRA
ncbi:MAG: lysophospholipid acyltransferase family protein [Acidobacteria bacterium]|nr:lysophospholipid acyltransferase family protein [Acidobacteriota bacterium]